MLVMPSDNYFAMSLTVMQSHIIHVTTIFLGDNLLNSLRLNNLRHMCNNHEADNMINTMRVANNIVLTLNSVYVTLIQQ